MIAVGVLKCVVPIVVVTIVQPTQVVWNSKERPRYNKIQRLSLGSSYLQSDIKIVRETGNKFSVFRSLISLVYEGLV